MERFLALYDAGPGPSYTNVLIITSGATPEEQATLMGLDAGHWATFDMDDFPGCEPWYTCFTLVNNQPNPNTVTFDLATAKLLADDIVKQQSVATQNTLLDGYTAEMIAAQAALPSPSRDVRFQNVITDINDEAAILLQRQVDISAAATIAEVNAIVFP
jgi:hypothetical protein